MIAIKNVINDRYIHDSSIKRKQVAEAKTNNGEFIGFIAPYGYKVVKKDNKKYHDFLFHGIFYEFYEFNILFFSFSYSSAVKTLSSYNFLTLSKSSYLLPANDTFDFLFDLESPSSN